jgi:hypothetical protein
LAIHHFTAEDHASKKSAAKAEPAPAPAPSGLQDMPVSHLRPSPPAVSRSLVRPPLPSPAARHTAPVPVEQYWFGRPDYYAGLTAEGKRNARIIYYIGRTLGKTTPEIGCTENIAYRESGIQVHDPNPDSEADGIPQANPASKMASAGPDWQTNPYTQVKWMYGYMDERYGGACNAWDFWQNNFYY